MQKQGEKIKLIARQKGLYLVALGEYAGYSKTAFSRKLNSGEPFSNKSLTRIAEYLGVTPEFLRDTSRPFNPGDEIPPDAIAAPTPPPTPHTPSDLMAAALSMERQAADMARSKNELLKIEVEAVKESQRQMALILNEALGKLAYIADVVKEIKDERDGGHDPD